MIIYNLQFEKSNFWFDIYSFISLLLFNRTEIALFSIASFCKDPRVQNIQEVKQSFAAGAEND